MSKWCTLLLVLAASGVATLSPGATTSARSPITEEDELLRSSTLVFARAVATPAAAVPAAAPFAGTAPFSMVPGALGHDAPVRINADLLAYAQFDSHFAGIAIDNWIVDDIRASNEVLYGRPYSTDDIVRGAGFFHVPSSARLWRDTLIRYFREMS